MASRNFIGGFAAAVALACLFSVVTESEAATRFGARLTGQVQPSNAEGGRFCDEPAGAPHPSCSFLMTEALGRAGNGHRAPKNGIIDKVRIIGCRPGWFQLQIARARVPTEQARVISNGPLIEYRGDPRKCRGARFAIEEFPVNVRVSAGDFLAIETNNTSTLQCAGNGGVLVFIPPLDPGLPFRKATENEGCLLLLEAEYND